MFFLQGWKAKTASYDEATAQQPVKGRIESRNFGVFVVDKKVVIFCHVNLRVYNTSTQGHLKPPRKIRHYFFRSFINNYFFLHKAGYFLGWHWKVPGNDLTSPPIEVGVLLSRDFPAGWLPSILVYQYLQTYTSGSSNLAIAEKWTPKENVFPIEHGDIPASYVSLPDSNAKTKKLTLNTNALNGFCLHMNFLEVEYAV